MVRPNTFKIADGCGEEASAQKNQNWGYCEPIKKYNGDYRRWVGSRIKGGSRIFLKRGCTSKK